MSALPKIDYYTPKAYLAMERKAKYKSEYFNSQIVAMAGASERHNLIAGNVFAEFHLQFKKRTCKTYSSDMRVKVSETGLYTYPDVVAVCDRARFDDTQKDTLLNPTVIVEVLSKSTKGYDRGVASVLPSQQNSQLHRQMTALKLIYTAPSWQLTLALIHFLHL